MIFNLGAGAWNGIAMSVNYSYAVMTGAEKNISGAEAIYQLEQYIKADYENMISNPKDYLQDTFTDLENYEDVAAALIARKFALKGPGKGPSEASVPKKVTVVGLGKIDDAANAIDLTRESVDDKLARYLLNPDHPVGSSKAKWFKEALGFTKSNADDLAQQIKFDPSEAVQTAITEHGTKFNQVIPITGANGRTIDVNFAWIKNNDGVTRLVTSIPTKK